MELDLETKHGTRLAVEVLLREMASSVFDRMIVERDKHLMKLDLMQKVTNDHCYSRYDDACICFAGMYSPLVDAVFLSFLPSPFPLSPHLLSPHKAAEREAQKKLTGGPSPLLAAKLASPKYQLLVADTPMSRVSTPRSDDEDNEAKDADNQVRNA